MRLFIVSMMVATACAVTGAFGNYWRLDMGDCEYSINIYLNKVNDNFTYKPYSINDFSSYDLTGAML